MKLIFLRHGPTVTPGVYAGSSDVALAPGGMDAMWRATDGLDADAVLSSPLSRCLDFARAWSQRHACPLTVDPAWRELGFGDWEGHTARELLETAPAQIEAFWRDPWAHPPPRGEPLDAAQARLRAALDALPAQHAPEITLLIVTHGGVMRLLFRLLLGLPPDALWRLELHPAARMDFVLDESGARLQRFDHGTAQEKPA
ncbi:MAG: histidine phosphatase family protein [Pseudomonadota bacterium]|jgi:broad specificity phosphatase PhoE